MHMLRTNSIIHHMTLFCVLNYKQYEIKIEKMLQKTTFRHLGNSLKIFFRQGAIIEIFSTSLALNLVQL